MALVRVDRGPITGTMELRECPREDWYHLMLARRDFLSTRLNYDCRRLVQYVQEAEVMYEPLGFDSAEHMIRDGFQLDPDDIAIAVAWLKKHEPEHPIGLKEILGKHGGDRRSEKARGDQGDNSTLKRGTGATYLRARLHRDRPDLAARVEAGELSAHAAACEAGFRRKTVSIDATDPERAAQQLVRVFEGEALRRLVKALR